MWPVVLLSYALSWACWIPAARLGRSGRKRQVSLLTLLGGFGPSLADLVIVARDLAPGQRRDWWARVVDPRRVDPRTFAVMLLFPASVGALLLAGSSGPPPRADG